MSPATAVSLETDIKADARALGFDLVGIARLGPADSARYFDAWLDAGYAGEMSYLARNAEKRRDTTRPVPDALSAIVVGMNYGGTAPSGPVARYARGDDYHDVMLAKLCALHDRINTRVAYDVAGKAYVDTGPILERDLARKAGLGWIGKSTNLINPELGSYFFIGALLLAMEFEPDDPFDADRCGTCTRCLDACPTNAFADERVLDATRCISYLTIEQRGPIPLDLREAVGDRAYGCDVCQEVCPWNVRFSRDLSEPGLAPRPENVLPDLREWIAMDGAQFNERFRKSPMRRAKRAGLARNAAVVIGNTGDSDAIPALEHALTVEHDPIVREHLEWARARIAARDTE